MYNRRCSGCGREFIDCLEPISAPDPICAWGSSTQRAWVGAGCMPNVIPDSIRGGIAIAHGLCNADGTPHRYYSRSEMRDEARARGLVNRVEHVPARGSDKSVHTVRWV